MARLITQQRPGFGGAYLAGFEQARGEYLLTLDADGSHDPAVLADLWTARQLGEVVIASRYVEGGAAAMPGWRQLLSRMLNAAFRRGLSLPVRDALRLRISVHISAGQRLRHRGDRLRRRLGDDLYPEEAGADGVTSSLVRLSLILAHR
ncbi:MAG TPA: glycosyltransferase family 2 protein [Candidatus Dormibacteraeota bacterium]|nr:glycosyltransferase family 2 protein [Candidatus Dormibacteraeota bacterium]